MPKNPESEGSRLITLKQIEQEHGVSRSALHTYRRSASFPQPASVEGSTRIQYRADEVAAWFAAHPPQQGKRSDLAPPPEPQGEPVTTTTDPRIAILSSLNDPPYNETAEKRCVPWDKAEEMLDAYRSKEWRLAAESIEQEFLRGPVESERDEIWNDAIRAAATVLRQEAKGPEAQDG
ncbi:helix-turn-helix transcriptional regulator [Streptomyces tendae]|uniref:helix-turn-helix transcriptional regulator n=1 Tax=Streptomyces tendae TaxID=1932 RepID=UPI0038195097